MVNSNNEEVFIVKQPANANVVNREVIVKKKVKQAATTTTKKEEKEKGSNNNESKSEKSKNNSNNINLTIPEVIITIRNNLMARGSLSIKKDFIANVANLLGEFYGKKLHAQEKKTLEDYVEKVFRL